MNEEQHDSLINNLPGAIVTDKPQQGTVFGRPAQPTQQTVTTQTTVSQSTLSTPHEYQVSLPHITVPPHITQTTPPQTSTISETIRTTTTETIQPPVVATETELPPQKRESTTAKLIGLILLFCLLFLAMVLTIFYIPRIIAWFQDRSTKTTDTEIIITPSKKSLNSGEAVLFSWNGPVRTNGAYILSYPCTEHVQAYFHTGESITCDEDFYFLSVDNTAALRIDTTSNKVSVPITIDYKDETEEITTLGSSKVTVSSIESDEVGFFGKLFGRKNANQNTNTGTDTTNIGVVGIDTDTNNTNVDYVDFTISMIESGYLTTNDTFVKSTSVPSGLKTAFRFAIQNTGTKDSDNWSFNASLPSTLHPTYYTQTQASLKAGERVEYTLGYIKDKTGDAVITVNADRKIEERSYSNNSLNINKDGNATVSGIPSSETTTTSTGNTKPTTTKPATTTTTKPATSKPAATRPSTAGTTYINAPTGKEYIQGKDLTVSIIGVGKIVNGALVVGPVAKGTTASAKFAVFNYGTEATGPWKFTAKLPSGDTNISTFLSPIQESIPSGQGIEFTIGWEDLAQVGNNFFSVTVDTDNSIREAIETNNTASSVVVGQ